MNYPQVLADHMLYQLDRMMLEHLQSFLREKIGDPFCIYCAAYEAQELRITGEAALRWEAFQEAPTEDKRLASRLVVPSKNLAMDVNREKQQTFDSLCEKTTDEVLCDLCSLYSALITERHALERAAAAIEWANAHGSKEYALKVEATLDLNRWILPWWWSLNLHNLHRLRASTDN